MVEVRLAVRCEKVWRLFPDNKPFGMWVSLSGYSLAAVSEIAWRNRLSWEAKEGVADFVVGF